MLIPVTVPSMLEHAVGGSRHVSVEAARLPDLIAGLQSKFPLLAPHVWDEQGKVRKHIMIFLNDQSIAWLSDPNVELREGDSLQIVQAVSGG